jgi:hypothetical protein
MLSSEKLKKVEADASRERMAEMMSVEEERQIELSRRLMKQKEEERRLLIYALAGVVAVLVFIILLTLVT